MKNIPDNRPTRFAMTSQAASGRRSLDSSVVGFGLVWIAGIFITLLSFGLTITGTLWSWGVPPRLIKFTLLVGVWQWIWIAPILAYARRTNRNRLYGGLRRGGMWFSLLQLSLCAVLYFCFRHFSFQ